MLSIFAWISKALLNARISSDCTPLPTPKAVTDISRLLSETIRAEQYLNHTFTLEG